MTKRNKKIKFIKPVLDKLKWTGKREWYSAENIESLCIQVNKYSKSYYSQWSNSKIVDGRKKRDGHRRYLAPYSDPLDVVKFKLRSTIDSTKKASRAKVDNTNCGAIARQFLKHGVNGQRVRTRGTLLKYKATTSHGYKNILERMVLLECTNDNLEDREAFKLKMTGQFTNSQGDTCIGALKDVPLDEINRQHIEVWMERMADTKASANAALAALSVAFEYDRKKTRDALMNKNQINPCLRVAKYPTNKDKKYVELKTIIKMSNHMEQQQWKDPHFLTYTCGCCEIGERQSDWRGTHWKKPHDVKAAIRAGCTGYLYKKYDDEFNEDITYLHIFDSKNRQPADVELTAKLGIMLDKLNEWRSTTLKWCHQSPFVFPQSERPDLAITANSYRFKMPRLFHKFGLATRQHVRSSSGKFGRKRTLYKYINKYTFKHLRKTFATYYSAKHGVEATSARMRHSSLQVTQDHYVNFQPKEKRTRQMYTAERTEFKPVALAGGKNDK